MNIQNLSPIQNQRRKSTYTAQKENLLVNPTTRSLYLESELNLVNLRLLNVLMAVGLEHFEPDVVKGNIITWIIKKLT